MKRLMMFTLMILIILSAVGCTPSEVAATPTDLATDTYELTVAAAASLTDVTAEIKALYEAENPGVTLTFTYASSGSLQTQIEQGAPVDVFISAAQKQMNALEEQSLILTDTRVDLLENKVVLIVPADLESTITCFEDLTADAVVTVAMGDPASVPAGQYAEEVLTSLGIVDAVEAKANFGTDVRQVLTWVENGEVDAGIVYATDAATIDKVTIICEAPADSVKQIIYPAAVLAASTYQDESLAFIEFLGSESCAAIFAKYGFTMVE
ncbi:MAG: molybdate ABC transporter substrate-binding protein [Eubacteriales bacterium]